MHRLAVRRERVAFGGELRFVVPGRALGEVSRVLDGESDDPAGMQISKKHIIFHIGDYQIFSRLLEGEFLDYHAAIPGGESLTVRINTRALIDAVERVSLLISDRIKSPLRVKFYEGGVDLSCSTALGRANDTISAAIEGKALEMGFNNRYLLDARGRMRRGPSSDQQPAFPDEGGSDSGRFLCFPGAAGPSQDRGVSG